MAKLSKPHAAMAARYDAVVIGSGYGGAIAASRLARLGLRVCLLERGREFAPGDFPHDLKEATSQFQADAPPGRTGARNALFDMRINADVSALVGCGLGGTSLINGNVMLRPEDAVFADPCWPVELADGADAALSRGYARAGAMLAPATTPNADELAKYRAFKVAAEALGGECVEAPISVNFTDRTAPGDGGVRQPACTLCGDCCSGCNVGAKNTTAMNYLPDAVAHGCHVFTGAQVRHVEPHQQGWRVVFLWLDEDTGKVSSGRQSVAADNVFIAAGTLGSSEILLRSRTTGLALSPRLGKGFSGNGDVIAFAYNNDQPINGIGVGHPPVASGPPPGPVIAGLIDLRTSGQTQDNIVIQEGVIPSSLAALLPALFSLGSPLFGDDTDGGDFVAEALRSATSLSRGAYEGAVANTQTFLVMAHDAGTGTMRLDDDRVRIDWPDAGDQAIYRRIDETLRRATAATGGTYIANPFWSRLLGRNLVTVHPLGGCAMGRDSDRGVVDHQCRVYDGQGAVHTGLHVVDGAIVPRSLGVNPSLTIAALAERALEHFAIDHGLASGEDLIA